MKIIFCYERRCPSLPMCFQYACGAAIRDLHAPRGGCRRDCMPHQGQNIPGSYFGRTTLAALGRPLGSKGLLRAIHQGLLFGVG